MNRGEAQLRVLVLGDEPSAWSALGFTVQDAVDDAAPGATVRLGNTLIRLTGSGEGFEGWTVDGVDESLDGLPAARSGGVPADAPDPHPNGIVGIDHVVVATGCIARTVDALGAAGIESRGGRSTASYGSPMRQVFFWLGDVILELVGPDDGEPDTDAPTQIFGLAFVASDLDTTADLLGELAGAPKDAVQPGRRIAGIRGREVGVSLPLAVMSPHPRA